ncbi:MAG: hypothetical protein KGH98_02555 [Candidatus Micrarchaeota archaeon]|nr:hypothetical protein [Candidatus Micrarchaeota archaeon]
MSEYEDGERSQARLRKRLQEQLLKARMEAQRNAMVRQLMDAQAYDRLSNIRIANPDLYTQVVNLILSLANANRLPGKLKEADLVSLLHRLTAKEEPKLEYKRK